MTPHITHPDSYIVMNLFETEKKGDEMNNQQMREIAERLDRIALDLRTILLCIGIGATGGLIGLFWLLLK